METTVRGRSGFSYGRRYTSVSPLHDRWPGGVMNWRILWMAVLTVSTPVGADEVVQTGRVEGSIVYPGSTPPALRVYAVSEDGQRHYHVTTKADETRFTITGVPPGSYRIVAYRPAPGGNVVVETGGWSRFVTCGMHADCHDHRLLSVPVVAGEATAHVRIADWFAPPGTFPVEPSSRRDASDITADCHTLASPAAIVSCQRDADQALARETGRLQAAFANKPACLQRLKRMQGAWTQWREQQCGFEQVTGKPGRQARCVHAMTMERVEYLRRVEPGGCSS